MPVPDDWANGCDYRGSESHLHQQKGAYHHQQRNNRVDHDAKLTVIRVGADGMNVRDLHHGQHRQKNKTHNRDNLQS